MFEIFKDRRVQVLLVVLTIVFMIIGSFRIDNSSNKYTVSLSQEIVTSLENSKFIKIEKNKTKKDYVTYQDVKFVLPNEKFKQQKGNENIYFFKNTLKEESALRIGTIFNVYTMLKEGKSKELGALEYDYESLFEKYNINSFIELFKYVKDNYKTEIKDDMSEDEKMMLYLSNSLSAYEIKGDTYIIEGNVKGFMCVSDEMFDIYLENADELYNFTFINNEHNYITLDKVKSFLENVVF